jgi:hypothetical protein
VAGTEAVVKGFAQAYNSDAEFPHRARPRTRADRGRAHDRP